MAPKFSETRQLPLLDLSRVGGNQIPQRICRIISANSILISIDLQNILGPVWIVLQRRQAFQ